MLVVFEPLNCTASMSDCGADSSVGRTSVIEKLLTHCLLAEMVMRRSALRNI